MRNTTTFLFVLTRVTLAICVLSCFGCGPTTDSAKIYNDLGLAKVELEQYKDAITHFDSAIERKPDFAEAYYNRGKTKIKLANKIDKIDADSPPEVFNLSALAYMARLYETAITDFNITIRLKPDHAYAYYSRGLLKLKLGTSEGEQDLQTALKLAEQAGDTQLTAEIEVKLHSLRRMHN